MLATSKLGPTFQDLQSESLIHACIFLARMWKLKGQNPDLFNSLYQLMDGDTNDIVSLDSLVIVRIREDYPIL